MRLAPRSPIPKIMRSRSLSNSDFISKFRIFGSVELRKNFFTKLEQPTLETLGFIYCSHFSPLIPIGRWQLTVNFHKVLLKNRYFYKRSGTSLRSDED
ncbi:MAG: hypothetical protein HC849_15165 [Oscillatoriales cyanobacterium RU_3_3]|nr:hypothetical protein [Oscillatoriales cyanobacterium RU_3_3]